MKDELDIKNLRTYEEDIKDALGDGNVTTTDIVMAEQKRRITTEAKIKESKLFEEAAPARPKHIPLIMAGLVFLVIGGGALYYGFTYGIPFIQKTSGPVSVVPISATNPVNPDAIIPVSIANNTFRDVIGEMRATIKKSSVANRDSIVTFSLTKDVESTVDGVTTQRQEILTTADFFTVLEANTPEPLVRSFEPNFIVGLHQKDVPEPFILLQTNDFEQSFAGMLGWEPRMVDDVRDIFFRNLGSSQSFLGDTTQQAPTAVTATSTDTTTNVVTVQTTASYNKTKFVDLVLVNKDVRAIQDFTGKTLFFYTFIDKKNLLITTNTQTLELIIRQLNIASLIR